MQGSTSHAWARRLTVPGGSCLTIWPHVREWGECIDERTYCVSYILKQRECCFLEALNIFCVLLPFIGNVGNPLATVHAFPILANRGRISIHWSTITLKDISSLNVILGECTDSRSVAEVPACMQCLKCVVLAL